MKLEIRDYSSGDLDRVWDWVPNKADAVYFHLAIEIGEAGNQGGDFFDLVVATPEGLREYSKEFGVELPDRCLLVFSEYGWSALVRRLESILESCARDTWEESVLCLQRYFHWEYEDFRVV